MQTGGNPRLRRGSAAENAKGGEDLAEVVRAFGAEAYEPLLWQALSC